MILSWTEEKLDVILDPLAINNKFNGSDKRKEYKPKGIINWGEIFKFVEEKKDKKYNLAEWNCQQYAKELLDRIATEVPTEQSTSEAQNSTDRTMNQQNNSAQLNSG